MDNIRILIVEDEILVANHLKRTLTQFGYEVTGIASSGQKALQYVGEHPVDLVLMDIVLKGEWDGVETADQIRQRWDIPIVYLTAYSDQETLNRAIGTNPFGYILKPFKEKDIYINIQVALHKHQLEKNSKLKIQAVDEYLSSKVEELVKSYHQQLAPHSASSASATNSLAQRADANPLTQREQEVLELIVAGRSTKEIASDLHVSVRTVESHRYHIMEKLDVHDIASLVRHALTHRLVHAD